MTSHLTIIAVLLICAGALFAAPEPPATQPASQPAPMRMERLSLVLLLSPDAPVAMTDEQAREIQKQHLAHMTEMNKQGKLVAAGPFGDAPDKKMRGMCLYRTSLEEAKACAEADPAVRAGRLRVEVLSWYTLKGSIEFPMAPATQEAK